MQDLQRGSGQARILAPEMDAPVVHDGARYFPVPYRCQRRARLDIPLHTNGSENDIRCQVTRRKISGGTRSETGRDCRDAFLGLMKTCDKLGVSFWDYLASRLDIPGAPAILPLPDLIRQRAAA